MSSLKRSLSQDQGPGYDNPTFVRGVSPIQFWEGTPRMSSFGGAEDFKQEDIDEESFRSDLERNSARSSLVGSMGPGSKSEHEMRHEQLLLQGNLRESVRNHRMGNGQFTTGPHGPEAESISTLEDVHLKLKEQAKMSSAPIASRGRTPSAERPRPSAPPHPTPRGPRHSNATPRERPRHERTPRPKALLNRQPIPRLSNCFGLVDTQKLRNSCCCCSLGMQYDESTPHNPRYDPPQSALTPRLETIPENQTFGQVQGSGKCTIIKCYASIQQVWCFQVSASQAKGDQNVVSNPLYSLDCFNWGSLLHYGLQILPINLTPQAVN